MSAKEHIRLQLSAYLDGELNAGEAERLTQALQGDVELRQELADLANVRTLLRSLPRERAGEDFIPCVLAEAERTQLVGVPAEEVPFGMRWARRLASAAVLLVAATIGVVIAMTLWAPPRLSYEVGTHRRSPMPPSGTPAKPSHPNGWASEPPLPPSDANSAAPGDRTPGDTSTVDALAMLMKDGRAIDGTSRGEVNGRDLPPPRLDAGRTEADEREQTNTEELRNLGRVGGLADAKPSFGPAPGGAGGGGAAAASTIAPPNGHDRPRGKGFAKDYAALDSALAAGDNNEIIFTDRLDDTQRQVEKVLLSNGIAPVPAKDAGVSPKKARQANENFYTQNRPAAGQVQYEVFVTPEQMTRVQEGINGLRARQNVSQELAFSPPDGAEGTRRRTQAAHSFGKALGAAPAGKFGLEDKAQDGIKAAQTKPADIAGEGPAVAAAEPAKTPAVVAEAPATPKPAPASEADPAFKSAVAAALPAAGAPPATAPAASAKLGADDAQWAMIAAKRETLLDHRKEAGDSEKAAETAKKTPSAPSGPAAEQRTAERADSKLYEHPTAKPVTEPPVMAKPSSVAAPEPPAPPAARPAPLASKELPSRSAGEKLEAQDVAHKAELPTSQLAADSFGGGKLVANAPAGGFAKAARDKTGWVEPARGAGMGISQVRVQPPAAPAAITPPAPATAPAAAGGEAVVEVKVLSGQDNTQARQGHELALSTGGSATVSGVRQQPAPAATQASQAQTPWAAGQAGPAIQFVTQQRLGDGQKAEGDLRAQGDSSPPTPAEAQANQTDQSAASQATVPIQGKLAQSAPAGQAQQVTRFATVNQQGRQSTSPSAAARVQRLLITVNFRGDGQSAEPRAKSAVKPQTQDQRPDSKD